MNDVKHATYQKASLPAHRFARLQIDLYAVLLAEAPNYLYKQLHVVISPRDVVAAAHIYPLHLWYKLAKFLLKRLQHDLQAARTLLTKCVKMKPTNAIKKFWLKICPCDAKSAKFTAWVVAISWCK